MKGLDLAEAYYYTHGAPMITSRFGAFAQRIAVGFVGPGSECLGFDDAISRDHDWGPGFCIWLIADDFETIGADLQQAYESLPDTFKGFGPRLVSPGEEARTGVSEISAFFKAHTGLENVPTTLSEWMYLKEQSLATCTNGRVFTDPLGEFSRWRAALLDFYPADVRLKKIASRCMTAAQAGQYNFARSLKRNERFAVHYAETKFCAGVISLVFLLNKKYTPFYKWMHSAMKQLPILGETIHFMISALVEQTDLNAKLAVIEEICECIIEQLKLERLSESDSDFLLDHAHSIHKRISDQHLREQFSVVD